MWPFGKSTQARLEEAIKEQEKTANLGISVSVKKNTAVMTGSVPSDNHKNLLTAIAQGINGIKNVDVSGVSVTNATTQTNEGTAISKDDANATDPSANAKAALSKIKAESSLANNPLDVLQKGSSIVLRGAVDSQAEFDKAKSLAASVEGVTNVDTSGLQIIQNASKLNVTDDDGDVVYTVQSGDTLSHIALHYYGDAGKSSYMKIAEANGLDDPNKINVGQKLKIPGTTAGPDAHIA